VVNSPWPSDQPRRVRLTYPSSHSDEDIEHLYNKYRTDFPERFRAWVAIERNFREAGDNPLEELNRHGIEFLMETTDWESSTALFSAWFDIRLKVIRFATAN